MHSAQCSQPNAPKPHLNHSRMLGYCCTSSMKAWGSLLWFSHAQLRGTWLQQADGPSDGCTASGAGAVEPGAQLCV